MEAGVVTLHPSNSQVGVAQRVPYQFTFTPHLIGRTIPASAWPHIRLAMVVSADRKLTDTDYFLQYLTPDSHKEALSEEWRPGAPPVELEDKSESI